MGKQADSPDGAGPWSGWLTHGNYEAVAARALLLLGGKRFTIITIREDPEPELIRDCALAGERVITYRDGDHRGFAIVEKRILYPVRTRLAVAHATPPGRERPVARHEPWVTLDDHSLTVSFRTGQGEERSWVFTTADMPPAGDEAPAGNNDKKERARR